MAQAISGMVTDGKGTPVKGAGIIAVSGSKGNVVGFARTKPSGEFTIKVAEGRQADAVITSCIGYAKDTTAITELARTEKIVLRKQQFMLKEVKVRSGGISERGDTLEYSVSRFKSDTDRSIADVIKRMPGLAVNGDGSIEFQGKKINKFYIEGMDLMGGKYSQASENLQADKVKTVQVLQNHEPVKMMRDVNFSEQAALNIVLKDDAKDVWQGTADAGSGTALQGDGGWLRDGRLTAMYFARKRQSISMYKTNNTGKDIAAELASHTMTDEDVPQESSLLSSIGIAPPDLDSRRYTFNDTHLFATNWLFSNSEEHSLRLQLSAMTDKDDCRQEAVTVYNDIAGGETVAEETSATRRRTGWQGELTYKTNTEKTYMTNILKGDLSFCDSHGTTAVNGTGRSTEVEPDELHVSDFFRITGKTGSGRRLSVNGYAAYDRLPGRLAFNGIEVQRLCLSSAAWGAGTFVMNRWRKTYIKSALSIRGKTQTLDTESPEATARETYTENRTTLTNSADYNGGGMKIHAELPVTWLVRTYCSQTRHDIVAEPRLSVSITPASRWKITVSYSHNRNTLPLSEIAATPFHTGYMTVHKGLGYADDTRSNSLSALATYKNTLKNIFGNIIMTYGHTEGNILYAGELDNGTYISRATDGRTGTDNIWTTGRISKAFGWKKASIGIRADYGYSRYGAAIGGTPASFSLQTAGTEIKLTAEPAAWMAAELTTAVTNTVQKSRDHGGRTAINDFCHSAQINIHRSGFRATLRYDLSHSDDSTVPVSDFLDLSLSYRSRRYEAGIDLYNITGHRSYERTTVSRLTTRHAAYRLRPREVMARVAFSF